MSLHINTSEVTPIQNNNDELTIVNSARVSFAKKVDTITEKDKSLIKYLYTHKHFTPFAHVRIEAKHILSPLLLFSAKYNDTDFMHPVSTLLTNSYYDSIQGVFNHSLWGWLELLKNNQLSYYGKHALLQLINNKFPSLSFLFEEEFVTDTNIPDITFETDSNKQLYKHHTFHIKAPIFVARQLAKHQIGLVWNEESRRYIDTEPEFYMPIELREKAQDKKQGSLSKSIVSNNTCIDMLTIHNKLSLTQYKFLLDSGVCPEQARMILPQNTITSWYWTGTTEAFNRIIELRTKEDTQQETREVVLQIKEHINNNNNNNNNNN